MFGDRMPIPFYVHCEPAPQVDPKKIFQISCLRRQSTFGPLAK